MGRKKFIIIGLIILVALLVVFMFADLERKDLGSLTIAHHDNQLKYCAYIISEAESKEQKYFKKGDTVCIECNTNWPPMRGVNWKCYEKIKFKSQDQRAKYKAEHFGLIVCDHCPDAKGYYVK